MAKLVSETIGGIIYGRSTRPDNELITEST